MILGKQTSIRNQYYLKYVKSSIFDNEDENEQIPEVTKKINQDKGNDQEFEPKYPKITAFQRYLNQYWKDDEHINNQSKKNLPPLYDDPSPIPDSEYNAKSRYNHEFFGAPYPKTEKPERKAKSVFQRRTYIADEEPSTNKEKKINFYKSNIFHLQELDNQKVNNSLNYPIQETKPKKQEEEPDNFIRVKKKPKDPLLGTNQNWLLTNIELQTKNHIKRSKESRHKICNTFCYSKPKDFTKETSDHSITKTYYGNCKKIENPNANKEVLSYSITGDRDLFNRIDQVEIKKLLQENRIHVYDYNDSMNNNLLMTNGKIEFKVRKDIDDEGFSDRLLNVIEKIEEEGGFVTKISNDHHKKKERDATPGTALRGEGIRKNHTLSNLVPQYNIKFKNEELLKEEKARKSYNKSNRIYNQKKFIPTKSPRNYITKTSTKADSGNTTSRNKINQFYAPQSGSRRTVGSAATTNAGSSKKLKL